MEKRKWTEWLQFLARQDWNTDIELESIMRQPFEPALFIMVWLQVTVASFGAVIAEDFANNPPAHGWRSFGDTNLFVWNATNGSLDVIWDSSRTNSYFYLPLGTILNRYDDFSLALDLQLNDVAAGVNTNKPSTFELAFGFFNPDQATQTNFFRGSSFNSPNLVEFDFFPESEFAPTVWPSIWSTNSVLNYSGSGDYTIMNLPTGVRMRISMSYRALDQTLTTSITTNGSSIAAVNDVIITSSFTDFRVTAFGLESYSDAGQDPRYGGSLLAHGTVDNIMLTIPPWPVQDLGGKFATQQWTVSFMSRTNWFYTLERTTDFRNWAIVSPTTPGSGALMALMDTNPPALSAYYHVRAQK